jgi:formamidopyrimidine-DNA glycosylase
MPELPEVETVRIQLNRTLKGTRIASVEILKSGREFPVGKKFVDAILGRTITSIDRRAKLLIWKFDDGSAMTAHLKMTGKFVFVQEGYEPTKHDRMVFHAGDHIVVWSDVRQFGFVKIVNAAELESIVSEYGPEPLVATEQELAERLAKKSARSIKATLLDQSIIAGIGNIYADESLHRAGIRPTRRTLSLTEAERLSLALEIKKVLAESLAQKGTSANDYVDTQGEKGGFLGLLRVYGRKGEPCRNCNAPITKIVLAQRGTHYCAGCQK